MFTYAAYADNKVSDEHIGAIQRLCAALGSVSILRSVPTSDFALIANKHHSGTKYTIWHQVDDSGILVNLSPKNSQITKLLISRFRGYSSMSQTDKNHAAAAMAAMFGIAGNDKVKFLLTYLPTFKDSNIATNIALNEGIKVFNLANTDDIVKLAHIAHKLRA